MHFKEEAAVRNLYRELRQKARTCRNRDVRIKVELICLALKIGNVTEACRRMGFSRKFYYRWWRRLKRSGYELWALEEKSTRPKRSPGKIDRKIERAIHWYKQHDYGSRMIEEFLRREGKSAARSTIGHILNNRNPPIKSRRERLKKHRKRYELLVPGQRFQLDVKYVPERVNGMRAYNYVIIDESTRWRFAYAFDSLSEGTTVQFLELFKKRVPFPVNCIQTDNGHEFTYSLNPIARHLEHAMDRWCKTNNIKHRLIPPGVKELNGKVERSHRLDEHYFYWKAPTSTLEIFNAAQVTWMRHYNAKRPHGGIEYLTPWEKITERYEALRTSEPLEEIEAELARLKFVRSAPKRRLTLDERLDVLDAEFQALIKLAA
jgi:transposase InsO family protein